MSNYVLVGGLFVGLVVDVILKNPVFLTVAVTLCGVLVMMFIVLICTNIWFEKHN